MALVASQSHAVTLQLPPCPVNPRCPSWSCSLYLPLEASPFSVCLSGLGRNSNCLPRIAFAVPLLCTLWSVTWTAQVPTGCSRCRTSVLGTPMSEPCSCHIWLRCGVPCASGPRPEGFPGPPRGLILGELGCSASSHGSGKAPSLTSSTVEIDILLHFCRFTKI